MYSKYSKNRAEVADVDVDCSKPYSSSSKRDIYSPHKVGDKTVMICQLDTEHIVNIISILSSHMAEISPTKEIKLDPLTLALCDNELKTEVNKDKFIYLLQCLQPYVFELLLRQSTEELSPKLKQVIVTLQSLFNRTTSVPAPYFYVQANEKFRLQENPQESICSPTLFED